MNNKWKPQEKQFLTDNYPQNGYAFCAKTLNRELSTVKTKVKRMKLSRTGFKITDQQKDFVLNNFKSLGINETCNQSQLKRHQVYQLLVRNGIKLAQWTQFTAEEEKIIRDNFTELSNAEIGVLLNRTSDSIHAKLQLLKLKRTAKQVVKIRRRTCSNSYFPKGHVPHNTKSDGEISLRVYENARSQKYIRVSLANWMPLQLFNWEQVNGPVPEGMVLRCLSDNKLDCKPNNWELINRTEHLEKNAGRDTLDDKYITNLLAHKNRELRPAIAEMPELIELKRNQIKIRRTINELT